MANFTININAQINTPYETRVNIFSKGNNCTGFIFENTAAIASEVALGFPIILLSPWMMSTAGLTLTTMYIKDLIYTDSNKLWYEYNGVKLLPSTEYVIDITGLGYEDIIPLFKLKGQQPPGDTTTQTINCKIALEDDSPLKYGYKNNTMIVYYDPC